MKTCRTCKHYKPGTGGSGRCGNEYGNEANQGTAYPSDSCTFHELADEWKCPRCGIELVDSGKRRMCPSTKCTFFVKIDAIADAPKAKPLVTHKIEHMPECSVRSTPLKEIPFNFGTAKKLAAAGCNCPVTFEVKA